jgi:hypothetical protein
VASRCPYRLDFRAVAISFSTSLAVRYSRVRATEEFTMVGAEGLAIAKAVKILIPDLRLREYEPFIPQSDRAIGGVRAAAGLPGMPLLSWKRPGWVGHTHKAAAPEFSRSPLSCAADFPINLHASY